jgi:hypothetical protein
MGCLVKVLVGFAPHGPGLARMLVEWQGHPLSHGNSSPKLKLQSCGSSGALGGPVGATRCGHMPRTSPEPPRFARLPHRLRRLALDLR